MTAPYTTLLRSTFCDPGSARTAIATLEVRRYAPTPAHPRGPVVLVPVQAAWRSLAGKDGDAFLWSLMNSTLEVGGVVGMEAINGGLYSLKRWQELRETARVEGGIRRTAEVRGVDHVMLPFRDMPARRRLAPATLFCVPAMSWRAELCLTKTPCDPEIRVLVEHLCGRRVQVRPGIFAQVIDLPAAQDSASREHVLDALGGALVLASVILGVPLVIPGEVRAAQELARAEHRRKKSVRKTLAGLPPGYDVAQAKLPDGSSAAEYLGKRGASRGVKAGRRASGANTRARKAKGGSGGR